MLYSKRYFYTYTPKVPCIAIGNISWGGTGKTPLTDWFLTWAGQKNMHAVVLTRGYGGQPKQVPLLVTPNTDAKESGDEPLLLVQKHPKAHIVVHPKRAKGASYAEQHLNPDCFFIDDGMQHLGINRQGNFLLFNEKDLGSMWNKVIPAGSWREGASALLCADAFFLRTANNEISEKTNQLITKRLKQYNRPVFSFYLKTTSALALESNLQKIKPKKGTPYLLVSGVGDPVQVHVSALAFMQHPPHSHRVFADHHLYTQKDVEHLITYKIPILCTPKDAVKLLVFKELFKDVPLFVMQPEIVFGPHWFTDQSFTVWWENWWQGQFFDRSTAF